MLDLYHGAGEGRWWTGGAQTCVFDQLLTEIGTDPSGLLQNLREGAFSDSRDCGRGMNDSVKSELTRK